MAYTGITRLRLNMNDGSITQGSGEVVSARPQEGTSYGGYSEKDLQGIEPYSNYDGFVADCQSEKYKGSWQDPRAAEEFRELCAKRLAKMDQVAAQRDAVHNASQDTASRIVAADPNINPAIARHAVDRLGPFISREEREKAYADPRYRTSQDYRDSVVSRDAMTDF